MAGWTLIEANGHVYPQVDASSHGERALPSGRCCSTIKRANWKIVAPVEGTGLARLGVGRGLAYRRPVQRRKDRRSHQQYRRHSDSAAKREQRHQPLGGDEAGGRPQKSPRDAVGATVYLKANGFTQRADVTSGGSFASSSDPRLHFGLGKATAIDSVEVHWPDGALEQIKLPGVDAIYLVVEGSGVGKPIAAATKFRERTMTEAVAGIPACR